MENISPEDQIKPPQRKRLLTDPNPKHITAVTDSPESTLSFDSSSDRLTKKTRELPNLSDCHSCGVRINYTNPRERLQPLDSMWRIVLLCKKCVKRVNSFGLCTYCFEYVVDVNDCVTCSSCLHCVHKECVVKYGSGLRLGLEFSVCVDCWIPDAVAKSIRARKRKLRKRKKEICESSENNLELERKVAAGEKDGEVVLRKAVVAKNAGRKAAAGCEKVVGDAELAILLHRAINSSPRISRHACLVSSDRRVDEEVMCYSRRRASKKLMNSRSLDVPLICYSRRRRKVKGCLRNSESGNTRLLCYSRRRFGGKGSLHGIECDCFICKVSEMTEKRGSTSSAGLTSCRRGYGSGSSRGGDKCEDNDGGRIDSKPHRYLLKYYRIGKGIPRPSVVIEDSECCSFMDSANLGVEGMPDTRNFRNDSECLEICECDDNTNRYLLKYKRSSRYKPKFSCKVEEFSPMLPSNHPVEPTTLTNTI